MANVNQVALGDRTLIDLSNDTVTPETLLKGVTAHDASGAPITGNMNIVDLVYPIGSYYISAKSTDPSTLFGGTWERVKDKFILAAGDTYAAGATGGAATVSLTTANMPAHSHTRGTMNITGSIYDTDNDFGLFASYAIETSGALTVSNVTGRRRGGGDSATNPRNLNFNASNAWTGSTSSVGSGTAHNNMPPYVTAYCWKRTA